MLTEMIRKPAVAGRFYNDSPVALKSQFRQWIEPPQTLPGNIRALLVPHAGYMFSGETAAKAYARVINQSESVSRIILIGPSHHFYFEGCALPESGYFETPLGVATLDDKLHSLLSQQPQVVASDQAHRDEHCLEVQVPFIQYTLPDVKILPLLTGNISPEELSELIDPLWDEGTLLVISSDLSHFHTYEEAQQIDNNTCGLIESYSATLAPEQACGSTGINTLLLLAKKRGYQLHKLAQINSGDVHADKKRVVGYVSYIISES